MANPVQNRGGGGGTRSRSGWSSEQLSNAKVIAQVGRGLGASSRDIQIAIMAAIVESGLRNLNYGDRDSIGLFQQRNAWGSRSARLNPRSSARMFFLGGGQGQRGLLDFKDRNRYSLGSMAQRVQVSAFPSRYSVQQNVARSLMARLGNVGAVLPQEETYKINPYGAYEATDGDKGMGLNVTGPKPGASPANNPMVSAMDVILNDGFAGAKDQGMGTPEVAQTAVGVGSPDAASAAGVGAPNAVGVGSADEAVDFMATLGSTQFDTGAGIQGGFLDMLTKASGGNVTGLRSAALNMARKFIGTPYVWGGETPNGFDCSGLIQYVLRRMGVKGVPRLAYQQANWGTKTNIKNLKAGDLVFWGNSRRTQGNHIAFYLGNGKILEAPRPGLSVRIRNLGGWDKDDNAIGIKLNY